MASTKRRGGCDRPAKYHLARKYPTRYKEIRDAVKATYVIPRCSEDRDEYNRLHARIQVAALQRLAEEYRKEFIALKEMYRRRIKEERAALLAQKAKNK